MNDLRHEISIDGRTIGTGHPCFIIAEAGVNHNGSVDTALAMIDAIAAAGADCVKFQTFHADEFVSGPGEMYEYISQGEVVRESQLEMFRRLELKRDDMSKLFERARDRGLTPLSTPTDKSAADLLESLGVNAFKIGSDDLVYSPYLEYVAAKGKPMIISTGMADAGDIKRAITAIEGAGNSNICLLHCTSLYPAADGDVNLNKIPAMAAAYNLPVGFSDHSDGTIAVLGAVALGACIVEKHFTLDRNMAGPDHRFSANPEELAEIVAGIRRLEKSLGSAKIGPAKGELEMRKIARRSIVAAHDLPQGHVISGDDLAYQRPGTGMMPHEAENIIGKRALADIAAHALIRPDQLTE